MDPFSMIVAGLIATISYGLGKLSGRRSRASGTERVKATCECRHALSFHDPKTGECHGRVNGDPVAYDAYNDPTAWESVRCSCRQYVGPIPPEQMLASFLPREADPPKLVDGPKLSDND